MILSKRWHSLNALKITFPRFLSFTKRTFTQPSTFAQYNEHGAPEKVVNLLSTTLPPVAPNEVQLQVLFSPINPADLNLIEGTYGLKPKLPAIPGNEGVAKVLSVGSEVRDFRAGDIVFPTSSNLGTWRSHAVWRDKDIFKLSDVYDVKHEYLASLLVNPSTAFRLLEDYVELKEGDVIIQNGANSQVGTCVYQIASTRGIKTINVIRDRPNLTETISQMKDQGATLVITEDQLKSNQFKNELNALPPAKLALNMVGGQSSMEIAKYLDWGGVMVTYGGMSRRPVTIPTSLFIFKNIHLHGFWLTKWVEKRSMEDRIQMYQSLVNLMKNGSLKMGYRVFPFSKLKDALLAVREPYSEKVLLNMQE